MLTATQAPLDCRERFPSVRLNLRPSLRQWLVAYNMEAHMENEPDVLTIAEVARRIRCSKTHVQNAIHGRIPGMPRLTHLRFGRRKIIRREWLEQWLEANKSR